MVRRRWWLWWGDMRRMRWTRTRVNTQQNDVDGTKKGADSAGKVIQFEKSGWWFVARNTDGLARVTADEERVLHSTCTVWVKKNRPWALLTFPPNGWEFLINFFTRLLRVPIYARLQIFIQLSPTLTKLCHIKCDYDNRCVKIDYKFPTVWEKCQKTAGFFYAYVEWKEIRLSWWLGWLVVRTLYVSEWSLYSMR